MNVINKRILSHFFQEEVIIIKFSLVSKDGLAWA